MLTTIYRKSVVGAHRRTRMTDSKQTQKVENLDHSQTIDVYLFIEFPFWIPIKSDEYELASDQKVMLRNDYWLVSVVNIVDNPLEDVIQFIVNEIQISDQAYLERITGGNAHYYHKRKMKTTFTRAFTVTLVKGRITAQLGSEKWYQQMSQDAIGLVNPHRQTFLNDINQIIDIYSAIISTHIPSNEIRRVSFYEVLVHVLMTVKTDKGFFSYSTALTPDMNMASIFHPPFRVRDLKELSLFKETMRTTKEIDFHQLQWAKTLNHFRENRYQEALLNAAITLESLVHLYLSARERDYWNETKKGLPDWILKLRPRGLINDCKNVVRLWRLRNEVVHENKILTKKDLERIKKGIQSMKKFRIYLLQSGDPKIIELENKFSSFLELVPIGEAVRTSIGQLVEVQLGWRREKDGYQTVFKPSNPSSESTDDNEQTD